mmetsp:Transcript_34379/g.47625  ORF Transcript_34379/g.47625 Transcript_34379/m.47625 type:complete len:205 (-) Transcript_34379:13-627(-)
MPSSLATTAVRPCCEWRDSKDSMKHTLTAESSLPICIACDGRVSPPAANGPKNAPPPCWAAKQTPRLDMSTHPADVPSSGESALRGILGQPNTPTTTSPSSIKPKHTAYCLPATKPRVPSIGSKTQCRPLGPPGEAPKSIRLMTSSSDRVQAGSSSLTISFTNCVIRARILAFSSPVSAVESSSATMHSGAPGNARCKDHATTA